MGVQPDDQTHALGTVYKHIRTVSGTTLKQEFRRLWVNPFGAPEPLPILNPSNFVPKNGFPVVKGLRYTGT